MDHFSKEVSEKLKYYVYRLIDPRTGQTFYVGKGRGNRVFDHAKGKLSKDRMNRNLANDVDSGSLKLSTIRQIKEDNLNVIYVIHRWGLSEKEAFIVESALIDAYPGLTNIQNGHGYENGVNSPEAIERILSSETYEEPTDLTYLIIKVKQQTVDACDVSIDEDPRYVATRASWRIDPDRARSREYVFSVTDGIVRAVYRVSEWEQSKGSNRYEFKGEPAPESVASRFVGKRIPKDYSTKGAASPVLYGRNETSN